MRNLRFLPHLHTLPITIELPKPGGLPALDVSTSETVGMFDWTLSATVSSGFEKQQTAWPRQTNRPKQSRKKEVSNSQEGERIFPLTLSKSTLSYASLRTEVWKSAKDSLVIGCKSTCTYPRLARKIPY